MLNTFGSVVVILACPVGSLVFLLILNHFWPVSRRRVYNDVIGVHIVVLGTIYAVMLGFMLFAVWTSYLNADINAEAEANCLVSIYRLAAGLPTPERDEVRRLAREYDSIVIEQEWPSMHKGELSLSGLNTIQQLWNVVVQTKAATLGEEANLNRALTEISAMTEHRRIRFHDAEYTLPAILWWVLIFGGLITMLSSCLFGVENFRLHCAQVATLTLVFALILVAIGQIDHPFQGAVHIDPRGFERARTTFSQIP